MFGTCVLEILLHFFILFIWALPRRQLFGKQAFVQIFLYEFKGGSFLRKQDSKLLGG